MIRFIIYIFAFFIMRYLWKRPYYSSMFLCLLISLSPFINIYITELEYYFFICLIIIILIKNVIKDKLIHINSILISIFVITFLLLEMIFISISFKQFVLSLYKYLIIPVIAYYSVDYAKRYQIKISEIFFPYILINLFICYYRAFVDYSFFGSFENYTGTIYESFFAFGGSLFRPSNLNSPIVFSIELVTYWSLYLYENGKTKKFYLFTALGLLPLYLMKSRSSFLLLLLLMASYLIYNKEKVKLFGLSILSIGAMVILNNKLNLVAVLTLKESSYAIRFNSALVTIVKFWSERWTRIILGSGAGTANMIKDINGDFLVYVENFHLALLYDAGIFIFFIWIYFNIKNLIILPVFINRYSHIAFTILGILIINMFSSNMTGYTVQILYWELMFILKGEQKDLLTENNIMEGKILVRDI